MSGARPEMSYLHPAKISPMTLSVQAVLIHLPRFEAPDALMYESILILDSRFVQVYFSAQADGSHGLVLPGQGQSAGLKKVHPASQGFIGCVPDQLGVIVVLGDVRQNQELRARVVVA